MTRAVPGGFAALVAATLALPVAAQDHGGHGQAEPQEPDHCAMGHLPPEQCPPTKQPVKDVAPMDHAEHGGRESLADGGPGAALPEAAPPPRALEGPQHAGDAIWGAKAMARARAANHATHGDMRYGTAMAERLELRAGESEDGWLWDVEAWYGGDIDKFVLKSEGEGELDGALEDAEVQALWSHAIGPWFDLQAGARLDLEPDTRAHLAVGVNGLAPYMIHLDAAAFMSDRGDLTARLEAEHDWKLTQRLILQPRAEMELAAQDIPVRGVGAGLTKIEAGLRLRYEIIREFAPYIGVGYEAKTGRTADLARSAGDDPDRLVAIAGIRVWF